MRKVPYSQRYVAVLARALDLFIATAIKRDYGVTVSSWCGLTLREGNSSSPYWNLGKFLNKLQKDHCELAMACDRERAEYVLETLPADAPRLSNTGQTV